MKAIQLILMFAFGAVMMAGIVRVTEKKREEEAVRQAIAFLAGIENTDPGQLGIVFEVAPQLYDLCWLKICEANKINKNYDYAPQVSE